MLVAKLLGRFLRDEAITLIDHAGNSHHCGPRWLPASLTVRIHDKPTGHRLLLRPQLAFGEGYTSGAITVEKGSLRDLIHLLMRATEAFQRANPAAARLVRGWSRACSFAGQLNNRAHSKRNVEHHYDIGNRLFELTLDSALQYTCGYFPPDALPVGTAAATAAYFEEKPRDLDHAQQRRMAQMIAKLGLEPGMRVLEIGCGWGGFAIEMARQKSVEVHGISLSKRQLEYAAARIRQAGLSSRITLDLIDYRDVKGTYDRVVAAGVLEHIGRPNLQTFFASLRERLRPDGVLLIDSTGRVDGPGGTNPWLKRHIYPGGYIPSLSEVTRAVEKSRLEVYDVDIWRGHYGLTVREWERRLAKHKREITALMGEEFVRMWEFYLTASEISFIHGRFVNFQLQISNSRFALPITRDYLADGGASEVLAAPAVPEATAIASCDI